MWILRNKACEHRGRGKVREAGKPQETLNYREQRVGEGRRVEDELVG